MSPQEWQRAKPVLSVAAGLAGHQRARLIEAEFPDEPTLRREVLVMLETHDTISRALGPAQVAALSASSIDNFTGPPYQSDEETLTVGVGYGPYRVIRALGAGGMGQVFLAEDTRLGRRVALKSLAGRWLTSPNARQRLLREARAVAALSHPHIATLYDVLEDGKHLLLVMEYVEGRTAAALVAEGPIPLGQALHLVSQIIDAVVYAHDRGIVHCDLKPLNVQVATDGTAKVLDFGLAHAGRDSAAADAEADVPHLRLIGTPPYMPPERLLTGTLNQAGDVYSLGVTLFELVTGQRPFQESSFALLTGAILGTTPPPASSIASDCPSSLDSVIARALEKDPKRRYQTARELARDVRAVLGDIDNATHEIGRTPVSDTPWFHSRILTVVATVIAIVIILTFSGFVTSTIYGSPLGLTIQSQGESPAWWLVWGLRSLVFPLALMGFWITVLLVLRELYKTVAARSPLLQRWSRPIRTLSQHGRSLPSTTLAAGLLVAHVMAVGTSLWWFGDILTGINSFVVESGDLSALSRANVGQHQLYRSIHSILLFVFGIAWYRLMKLRTLRGERVWDTTMIAGLMATVITLFFVVLPYRLLVHSEGERVTHHADRCYLVGQRGDEATLFCPGQPPPWKRRVKLGDPAVVREGTYESIFSVLPRVR